MNTTKDITIHNPPRQTSGVPDFSVSPIPFQDESIISEVGPTITVNCAGRDYDVFPLRASSKRRLPTHLYGKAVLHDALSCWCPQNFALPAQGSSIVLDPLIPQLLHYFISWFKYVQLEVVWVIQVPLPFGASYYLEASAVELSAETTVRGVKWKPNKVAAIGFNMGWHMDRLWASTTSKSEPGYPSFSLKLTTLQSNSNATAATPIKGIAWSYIRAVHCTSWVKHPIIKPNATTAPYLLPVYAAEPPPAPSSSNIAYVYEDDAIYEEQAGEAQPGEIADSPVAVEHPPTEASSSDSVLPAADTILPLSKKGVSRPVMKDPSRAINSRWTQLTTMSLDIDSVDTLHPVTVQPAARGNKGDDIGVPFRKSIFTMGTYIDGFARAAEFKVVSTRSPSVAGTLAVYAGPLSTVDEAMITVEYHTIGALQTTVSSPFDQHYDPTIARACKPSLSCNSVKATCTIVPIVLNFTAEVSSINITVFVRFIYCKFFVPTKPKAAPSTSAYTEDFLKGVSVSKEDIYSLARMLLCANYE